MMGNNKRRTRIIQMCLTALFCAFISVCSWVSIPMPSGVAITLQTFAVSLCGCVLGSLWGAVCVVLYLCVGAVGFPVFSAFSSGFGQIAGPTGGFLIGFLMLAALCGITKHIKNTCFGIIISFLGLALCHLTGIFWFASVSGNGIFFAASICSFPYLLKDIILVFLAFFTSKIKIIKKLTI